MQISLWNVDGALNELLLLLLLPRPSVGGETRKRLVQSVSPAPGDRRGSRQGEASLCLENIPRSLPANRPRQSRLVIRLKIPGHFDVFQQQK